MCALLIAAAPIAIGGTAIAADERRESDSPAVETAALDAGAGGAQRIALPEVLSEEDAVRYRRIFALQKDGRWGDADREIKRLSDRLLMGHVLGQRYLHPTAYRSQYHELKHWLHHYADHPEARRIYRLALRRKPAGARRPHRPVGSLFFGPPVDDGEAAGPAHRSTKRLTRAERARVRAQKAAIRRHLRRGDPEGAEGHLRQREVKRLFDHVEYDQARADTAAGYFGEGKDRKALKMARASARRSADKVPLAPWTAGLAAWRLKAFGEAAPFFETLATASAASSWDAAAGAFWAARANLMLGRPARVTHFLELAAKHGRTFYGLLARRLLGRDGDFDWSRPALGANDLAALMHLPAGRRTLALIQVGQTRRAESELRRLYPEAQDELGEAILALALGTNMPALAMRVGADFVEREKQRHDGALYPLPGWQPEEGYRVDRALLFAFIRQESKFNPRAKSPRGARGLMQIMPLTASFVAGERFRGRKRDRLFDPELNLALGQEYLRHLLEHELVQGNLLLLAAAYNGGPGNLARWQRRLGDFDDPLIFLESIPSRETRTFVERVLTNLWIYRRHLGQPTPSLDAIAAGEWPVYESLDDASRRKVAGHAED